MYICKDRFILPIMGDFVLAGMHYMVGAVLKQDVRKQEPLLYTNTLSGDTSAAKQMEIQTGTGKSVLME